MEEQIQKRNKGFTLVELIVVIAIIGILAAVLVPSLTSYIGKTKNAVCEQNLATCNRQMEYASIYENFSTQESFLAKIVESCGAGKIEYDSTSRFSYVSGLCPYGGKYYLTAAEPEEGEDLSEWEPHFKVHCTHHNKEETKLNFDATKSFTSEQFKKVFDFNNKETAISQLVSYYGNSTDKNLDSSGPVGSEVKPAVGLQFGIPVGYPFDFRMYREKDVQGTKDGKQIIGKSFKLYIHFGELPSVQEVIDGYVKEAKKYNNLTFSSKDIWDSVNVNQSVTNMTPIKLNPSKSGMTKTGKVNSGKGNILDYRYGKDNHNGYTLIGYRYILWADGSSDLLLGTIQKVSVHITLNIKTINGKTIPFPHTVFSCEENYGSEFSYPDGKSLVGFYNWGGKNETNLGTTAEDTAKYLEFLPCYINTKTGYLKDTDYYKGELNTKTCSGTIDNIVDTKQ